MQKAVGSQNAKPYFWDVASNVELFEGLYQAGGIEEWDAVSFYFHLVCSNKNVFYMLCIHIYITLEECNEFEFDDIVSCCKFFSKKGWGWLVFTVTVFFVVFFSVEEQSTLAAGR